MNNTQATVIGNLSSSVTDRRTADGTPVANFRLASNERRYDRTTGQWVDGDHLYVEVTCWRRLAENVAASLVMGDPVVVTGRIYTREYETAGGERRSVTALEASSVGAELARCRAAIIRPNRRVGESGEAAAGVVAAPTRAEPVAMQPEAESPSVDRGPLVAVPGGGGA